MFKVPRVNVIESDDGFSVEVLGRTGLLYIEGAKSLHIDSEFLAGSAIAIVKDSIHTWDYPFDSDILDDDDRNTVIENIRSAFRFRGISISVY